MSQRGTGIERRAGAFQVSPKFGSDMVKLKRESGALATAAVASRPVLPIGGGIGLLRRPT